MNRNDITEKIVAAKGDAVLEAAARELARLLGEIAALPLSTVA